VKCENRFLLISSSEVDQFTSNQDHNDQQTILHISLNTFHEQKCFVFVIFVCKSGRAACAAATWP